MKFEEKAMQFGADPHRVAVWHALSEFFLDTELDANDLERIAKILASSPFSIDELRHIDLCEVRPVCLPNLFVMPGGEWGMFASEWLIPRCLSCQRHNPYVPDKGANFFQRTMRVLFPSNVPVDRIEQLRSEQK